MRQDDDIAHLILINGPPGVGKSTLARRYLEDHPLTLLVEIDEIRVSMGRGRNTRSRNCWPALSPLHLLVPISMLDVMSSFRSTLGGETSSTLSRSLRPKPGRRSGTSF